MEAAARFSARQKKWVEVVAAWDADTWKRGSSDEATAATKTAESLAAIKKAEAQKECDEAADAKKRADQAAAAQRSESSLVKQEDLLPWSAAWKEAEPLAPRILQRKSSFVCPAHTRAAWKKVEVLAAAAQKADEAAEEGRGSAEEVRGSKRRAEDPLPWSAAWKEAKEAAVACWRERQAVDAAAATKRAEVLAAAQQKSDEAAWYAERQRESVDAAAAATKRAEVLAAAGKAEAARNKRVEEAAAAREKADMLSSAQLQAEMMAAAKKKQEGSLPWSAAWKEAGELAAVRQKDDEQLWRQLLGSSCGSGSKKKAEQLAAQSRLDREEAASNKYLEAEGGGAADRWNIRGLVCHASRFSKENLKRFLEQG